MLHDPQRIFRSAADLNPSMPFASHCAPAAARRTTASVRNGRDGRHEDTQVLDRSRNLYCPVDLCDGVHALGVGDARSLAALDRRASAAEPGIEAALP